MIKTAGTLLPSFKQHILKLLFFGQTLSTWALIRRTYPDFMPFNKLFALLFATSGELIFRSVG